MTVKWTEKITGCLQWKTTCFYGASVPLSYFETLKVIDNRATKMVLVHRYPKDFFFQ